jgi:F-type H+-transporting ATPase subunit gamma
MATLREIRRRISSIQSTQQITKAMKMVASVKLRKAQENIFATRPYAKKLQALMGRIISRLESSQEILLQTREVKKILLMVVTADRGLCGAFNANIIRFAENEVRNRTDVEVLLYPIGRKGYEYFSRRDFDIYDHKINFFNFLDFEDAQEVIKVLVAAYEKEEFDQVEVIYNEFKSAVQQNVVMEQILPFQPVEEETESHADIDFLYEPEKEEILHNLIPKQLNIQMWKVLLESNAAEQGARMTAMENATDNADDIIAYLTLHYNRARQAAITKEISEIVGGAEALKEK